MYIEEEYKEKFDRLDYEVYRAFTPFYAEKDSIRLVEIAADDIKRLHAKVESAEEEIDQLKLDNLRLGEHLKELTEIKDAAIKTWMQEWMKVRNIAQELHSVLEEVMSWIENWSPDFVEDAEWDETLEKVNKVRRSDNND